MAFPVIPGIIAGYLAFLIFIIWGVLKAFSRSTLLGLLVVALSIACIAFPPLSLLVFILFAVTVTIAFIVSLLKSI